MLIHLTETIPPSRSSKPADHESPPCAVNSRLNEVRNIVGNRASGYRSICGGDDFADPPRKIEPVVRVAM